ncbi:MAG: nicotinate phosphoribosyltransferase, partial [Bacteroidaceae bacterium]
MKKQIITQFSDQDLYSFTVGLFYLTNFSESIGEYSFVDRNKTKYPPGFAAQVMEQVQLMDGLSPTEEEIKFLKERCG